MVSIRNASLDQELSNLGIQELGTLGLLDRKHIHSEINKKVTRKLWLDARFNLVVESAVHFLGGINKGYMDIIPGERMYIARMSREAAESMISGAVSLDYFSTKEKVSIKAAPYVQMQINVMHSNTFGYDLFLDEHGNVVMISNNCCAFIPASNVSEYKVTAPKINRLAIMEARNITAVTVLAMVQDMPTEDWVKAFNITQEEIDTYGMQIAA